MLELQLNSYIEADYLTRNISTDLSQFLIVNVEITWRSITQSLSLKNPNRALGW